MDDAALTRLKAFRDSFNPGELISDDPVLMREDLDAVIDALEEIVIVQKHPLSR